MAMAFRCKAPVSIHTDGSCLKNPGGVGGWAAIIRMNGKVIEIFGGEVNTTNNRMELMAALKGLESLPDGSDVYLFTDSKYLQRGMLYWVQAWRQAGWKTREGGEVANRDLWERLSLEASRHVVSWQWVKGHAGDQWNVRCDELASQAAHQTACN